MPPIKPTATEQKKRVIRSIIAAKMELNNISDKDIATRVGIVTRTFQLKKKRPETFTMGELWDVCRILKIDDEEKAKMI